MTDDELTEDEASRAEEAASSHRCSNCGRSDWLAERRSGEFVILDCDDCTQTSIKVRVPKTN